MQPIINGGHNLTDSILSFLGIQKIIVPLTARAVLDLIRQYLFQVLLAVLGHTVNRQCFEVTFRISVMGLRFKGAKHRMVH